MMSWLDRLGQHEVANMIPLTKRSYQKGQEDKVGSSGQKQSTPYTYTRCFVETKFMVGRRKTLVVDFNAFQVRLDAGKLQLFLGNDTQWSLTDINSIQLLHTRNCVLIEMEDNGIQFHYEKAHNVQCSLICCDEPFKIPVYVTFLLSWYCRKFHDQH